MYSFVKIYIPPEKLNDVQSISGSVNYDPLKHELFARCASFQANFATLRTVFNTLDEESTDYSTNIVCAIEKENNDCKDKLAYLKIKRIVRIIPKNPFLD